MTVKNEKQFAQNKYIYEWRKANYDYLKIPFSKRIDINKTLDIASKKAGISKREYVRQAIIKQLKIDGFDVEAKVQTSIIASSAALPDAAAFEEGEVHS